MISFLFPGQGSEYPGMLRALDSLEGAGRIIDRASDLLQRDLRAEDASYDSTDAAQRALFICGVASAGALAQAGIIPDAVAGQSVGAIAAAHVAGAVDFATALALVDRRGSLMAQTFPAGYAMGVICGLPYRDVQTLITELTQSGALVYAANVNARDQLVVSGTVAGVSLALRSARSAGASRAEPLEVGIPSHSPFMHAVSERLRRSFAHVRFTDARIPYVTNAGGRLVRRGALIEDDLYASLQKPVLWRDATEALYETGVKCFVEMLPGRALRDLARAAFPDAVAIALDGSTIDDVRALSLQDASRR